MQAFEDRKQEGTPRRRRGQSWAVTLSILAALTILLGSAALIGSLRGVHIRVSGANGHLPGQTPAYLLASGRSDTPRPASTIYSELCRSCVGVTTSVTRTNAFGQSASGAITGSGFLLSEDGYVVTNYHVIQTAREQDLAVKVMLYDGRSCEAAIIGGDEESDVALLKLNEKGLSPVVIGDYGGVTVGETVYAIGNPLGELTYSMTGGIVSALDRSIATESNVIIHMFQIDAAINQGNSGGPVLNTRGEVIGIASAKYASSGVEGLGFAIPIDDALRVVEDLGRYGYVRGRVSFGIQIANAAYYGGGVEGALVLDVGEGSCSRRAGLLKGDVIQAANGQQIRGSAELIAMKSAWKPGDTVTLTVLRGSETLELAVTLDEKGR